MAPLENESALPLPRLERSALSSGSFFIGDPALGRALLAFTSRHGGTSAAPYASRNLGRRTDDDAAAIERNIDITLTELGLADARDALVNPVQVHGEAILALLDDEEDRRLEAAARHDGLEVVHRQGSGDVECDAVVCTAPGIPVMLCFADCVPVAVVAPDGSFAAIHSGWRGTIADIAGKGATALARALDCDPASLNAYIGPHIGTCCYEVSDELAQRFAERFGAGCIAGERHLDLEFAVRASLVDAGIAPGRIASAGVCTSCDTGEFFSHRAEHGTTGRFGMIVCKGKQGSEWK
ncbi:MAG: polyphenol oxidase family protein [Coriobacteriales bacterium]